MDNIDKRIEWCFDNNACVADKELLDRIGEGTKMMNRCTRCQSGKTGEGYDSVPPTEEWMANDEECATCECKKWFDLHMRKTT